MAIHTSSLRYVKIEIMTYIMNHLVSFIAAYFGFKDIVQLLLSKGSNLNIHDGPWGYTSLQWGNLKQLLEK